MSRTSLHLYSPRLSCLRRSKCSALPWIWPISPLNYSDVDRIGLTLDRYLLTNCGTAGYATVVDPGKCCPPPARWWDDNGLVALGLLQASAQLGGSSGPGYTYLTKVQSLWPFIRAGQYPSSGSQWPGGGQRENEVDPRSPKSRFDVISTGATGAGDESMELLYLAANASDPLHNEYMNFVLANDTAIKENVRVPVGKRGARLYQDGYCPDKPCFEPTGNTEHQCTPILPQNQGFMIASDVLLYQITGDWNKYIVSAQQTADASLSHYNTPCTLWSELPIWVADYFTGLFQLRQYYPDLKPTILCSLEAYLDYAEKNGLDPTGTGLFNQNGIGGPLNDPLHAINQAAFVIMYSLLATATQTDDCSSVSKAWSALITAYTARDRSTYAAALQCLRTDIPINKTKEVSNGVSIGHFCSGGNNSITGPFPTGTAIDCANLPTLQKGNLRSGVVAYSDNFATCTGSCGP